MPAVFITTNAPWDLSLRIPPAIEASVFKASFKCPTRSDLLRLGSLVVDKSLITVTQNFFQVKYTVHILSDIVVATRRHEALARDSVRAGFGSYGPP